MTSYRKTRSAIIDATKNCLAIHGLRATSMIEIADSAEVSRATLYNHFRDKESVMRGLLEFEVARLFQAPVSLANLSIEISTDPAVATLRRSDPALLAQMASSGDDPLWAQVRAGLTSLVGTTNRTELALRWLIGQLFAPLSPSQSQEQAASLLA
ncbi:unannotated protein [freshwater metagenome]|nr:TetR family transcriptional regulator [Actinomycetota bacterium]